MSLGFFEGMFAGAAKVQAAQAAGVKPKVFDWNKAAQLIKDKKPQRASAGLQTDWAFTGGPIYEAGQVIPQDETYTYLASAWAIPELDLDGEVMPCFVEATDELGWDAKTYWPDSALAILNS